MSDIKEVITHQSDIKEVVPLPVVTYTIPTRTLITPKSSSSKLSQAIAIIKKAIADIKTL